MKNNKFSILAKQFALATFFVTLFATANAQKKSKNGDAPFGKGDNTIGLFAGLPIGWDDYLSGYTPMPSLGVIFDHGIIDDLGPGNLGVGGVVALNSAKGNYSNGSATSRNFIIAIRGTYHLTILADRNNKFDPYAGVTAGLRIYEYKNTYLNATTNSVNPVLGAFVGAKYNFASSFGAFAEVGYDISFVRGGICFNF